jgi:TRAP-type mannitol/chloroaromatic compound transport system substrate-binding protein
LNKSFIHRMGLVCAVVLCLAMLLGCTPTAPTPTATTPGQPAGSTTAAPAPTKAGEVITWRSQSSSNPGDALYWAQQKMCDQIGIASGGRLIWKLFPTGAIVSRTEQFDAVSTGAIECCPSSSENDWAGKDNRFELTSSPAGLSAFVEWIWENYTTANNTISPAEALFDTLYQKFNIKSFNVSVSSPEVEALSNKKIITPADYKGLTFRGAGWELEIISQAEFGAKPVFIASTDIYSSLQTGVIDAFESSNPYANYVSGYQDITKYWSFPGMHNFSQTGHMLINLDKWKSLPADLQLIVEMAAKMEESRATAFAMVESAKILPILQAKYGITFMYESPDVQNEWRKLTIQSAATRGQKTPEFLTEYNKQQAFQWMMDGYIELQTPQYTADYPGHMNNIPGVTLNMK